MSGEPTTTRLTPSGRTNKQEKGLGQYDGMRSSSNIYIPLNDNCIGLETFGFGRVMVWGAAEQEVELGV